MADLFDPFSTVPISPASQPIQDGSYAESRYRAKKRTPPVKPEPVEELEPEELGENEPLRQLDLDA
ncbi:MAG: hypothetical protein ACRD3O_23155 [Terriglobia bacterium]